MTDAHLVPPAAEASGERSAPRIAFVAEAGSSSGLPEYLADALAAQGVKLVFHDVSPSGADRVLARLLSVRPSRMDWFRAYERRLYYSPRAWRSLSRHAASAIRTSPDAHPLVLGGLFTLPGQYSVFATYTMRLALADGTSPWRPHPRHVERYLAHETAHFRNAAVIFTSASYVREHLIAAYGVDASRVHAVGMGLPPDFADPPQASRPGGGCEILFVGRTFDLKGGPILLRAFTAVRRRVPTARLTIIGPNHIDEPLPEGVQFVGPVGDRKALSAAFAQADLFVLPSLCDGFGFVFLEAMAHAVPCVGTTLNAMPEIIAPPDGGYVVPPGDEAALAAVIERFFALDVARRTAMSTAARARALSVYQWPIVASRMLEVWAQHGIGRADAW